MTVDRLTLVFDTSVLDLKAGRLLKSCFSLRFRFVAPDMVFAELDKALGRYLRALGLEKHALDDDGVCGTMPIRKKFPGPSLTDASALEMARSHSWMLLTGDRQLRQASERLKVRCHGALWLWDKMYGKCIVVRKKI